MSGGTQRRLAAIVAADVAGYSRLIGLDEEGTLAALRSIRKELIDPLLAKHSGRIANTAGDSLLLEFPSVVDAVRCSIAIQDGMVERNHEVDSEQRISFRVGIHLGDVISEGDDLLGDGVNVAARLEGLSTPGGVVLSDDAYRQVRDRLDYTWIDDGEHQVKNIARPVQIWRWAPENATADVQTAPKPILALPDKPSIAVLPFDNMSGDPEQEFFADGIAEDIITALSRFRSLFVIARNSSFTYKGRAVDITQIVQELGVRYVVEGSVRKAGERIRITAQLIDATTGNHLWADRFDGSLIDVFEFQDAITEKIVVVVAPEIEAHERERARRKPPDNMDAWELLQRGMSHLYRINVTDQTEASRLFREAIARDPEFSSAHAYLAAALWSTIYLGYVEDTKEVLSFAMDAAERAVSIDPNEPMARYAMGRIHVLVGQIELAISELQIAIRLNPNFAWGHFGLAFAYYYGTDQAQRSLPHFDVALRLSPRDPMRWRTLMLKGSALRHVGRYEEAIEACRQACQFPDSGFLPQMHLAAALIEVGRTSESQAHLEKAIKLEPRLSIRFLSERFVGMHETPLNNVLESLRKAGIPD